MNLEVHDNLNGLFVLKLTGFTYMHNLLLISISLVILLITEI